MKTQTILITLNVLIEVPDVLEDKGNTLLNYSSLIETAIDEALGPIPLHLGLASTSFTKLDPLTSNCGRCVRCGAWVTDRERLNAIGSLQNGARINGELLCDDDLPSDHRWAF